MDATRRILDLVNPCNWEEFKAKELKDGISEANLRNTWEHRHSVLHTLSMMQHQFVEDGSESPLLNRPRSRRWMPRQSVMPATCDASNKCGTGALGMTGINHQYLHRAIEHWTNRFEHSNQTIEASTVSYAPPIRLPSGAIRCHLAPQAGDTSEPASF